MEPARSLTQWSAWHRWRGGSTCRSPCPSNTRRDLAATVESVRAALGNNATTLQKVEFSCLANEMLERRIETLTACSRNQLVVAGIEAHVCVLQTVLDLAGSGRQVFVVAAAIGSRAATSKHLALQRMRDAGAIIVDTEMVMFEWLERAGTAEFKELQSGLKVPSRP